jgi:hypothetical protein
VVNGSGKFAGAALTTPRSIRDPGQGPSAVNSAVDAESRQVLGPHWAYRLQMRTSNASRDTRLAPLGVSYGSVPVLVSRPTIPSSSPRPISIVPYTSLMRIK